MLLLSLFRVFDGMVCDIVHVVSDMFLEQGGCQKLSNILLQDVKGHDDT